MKTHLSSIEPLESRIAPAVLVVTNLNDSGKGSLRAAIAALDAAHRPGRIKFARDLSGSIMLLSDLPTIIGNMLIAGPTPGIGKPAIAIDGANITGAGVYGIFDIAPTVTKGIKVTISNLTIEDGTGSQAGGAFAIDDIHGSVLIKDVVMASNVVTDETGPAKGGAIDVQVGTLTVQSCTLTGNMAEEGTPRGDGGYAAFGGAVYVASQGHATFIYSTISGNTAAGGAGFHGVYGQNGSFAGGAAEGGAAFNLGTLRLVRTTVSGNTAIGGAGGNGAAGNNGMAGGAGAAGGAAEGAAVFSSATLSVLDCTVSANTATGGAGGSGGTGSAIPSANADSGGAAGAGGAAAGGGVFNSGTFNLAGSKVTGNSANAGSGGSGGAGAAGDNGKNPPYNGALGGSAGAGGAATGGGIFGVSSLTLTTSTISGNTANGGAGGNGGKGGAGGYYYFAGNHTTSPFTLYGAGGAGGAGGTEGAANGAGIYVAAEAKISVGLSTISGNAVTPGAAGIGGAGGAGGTFKSGPGGITGATGATGATTTSYGGGLFADNSRVILVETTVVQNNAMVGGGLRLTSGINSEFYNSTIAQNRATISGGGVSAPNSPLFAVSTVIGENTSPLGPDIQGTIFAVHSLIENLGDATLFAGGGTLTNVDPGLGVFGFHGGSTETLPPAAHSPLLGAGSNPLGLVVDQRGAMRVVNGHIDIGAVELG